MPVLKKHYTIREVADKVGREKTTIIRWEKEGLIPRAKRDLLGWRYYSISQVKRIAKIAKLAKKKKKKVKPARVNYSQKLRLTKTIKKMTEESLNSILKNNHLRKELIQAILRDPVYSQQIMELLIKKISRL